MLDPLLLLDFLAETERGIMIKGYALYRSDYSAVLISKRNAHSFRLGVKSASGDGAYEVSIRDSTNVLDVDCECPAYERFGNCKHLVASMVCILMDVHGFDADTLFEAITGDKNSYLLKEFGSEWSFGRTEDSPEPQSEAGSWKSVTAPGGRFGEAVAQTSPHVYGDWKLQKKTAIDPPVLEHGTVRLDCRVTKSAKNVLQVSLEFDRRDTIRYRCSCSDTEAMCRHVKTAFLAVETSLGRLYFTQFVDKTEEKTRLLAQIGLTPDMPEAADVEFIDAPGGNLRMKLPSWLIGDEAQFGQLSRMAAPPAFRPVPGLAPDFRLGFVLNMNSDRTGTGFELQSVRVQQKAKSTSLRKLDLDPKTHEALLAALPPQVQELITRTSDPQLQAYLKTSLDPRELGYIYGDFWLAIRYNRPVLEALRRHYIRLLMQSWDELAGQADLYLLPEGSFAAKNLRPVSLAPERVRLAFEVTEDERMITLTLLPSIGDQPVEWSSLTVYRHFLFRTGDRLHLPAQEEDLPLLEAFAAGFVKIPAARRLAAITTLVPDLMRRHEVRTPDSMRIETVSPEPVAQVLLQEHEEKLLMVRPQFRYEDTVVDFARRPANLMQTMPEGGYRVVHRDEAREQAFFDRLQSLHPDFARQQSGDFFQLPFEEAIRKNWFIETVRQLQEEGVSVLGIAGLSRLRFDTHVPTWEMKPGSGIDWFDLQIEVRFGDQAVPLREVRKALLSKQNVVVLGDGSFGVLPGEWLEQYGLLLKMGQEQKDGTLRVSKLHFTLIDELHAQIDDAAMRKDIAAKKEKLGRIGELATVKPSSKIKAKLRPYQLGGFHWMQTLEELGWGGCLADDMGLGKTLQTIVFLQYLKERRAEGTSLVVCPTSLIYNWESELKKFAPDLRYHIYYGLQREFGDAHFQDSDVVITSYGLVRNDIGRLSQFSWRYVILDESQAIKNPDAQTTKAVQVLKAENRLALSGTPVQNNTFDLYAQFQFLNPGLLGNKEFFREEFANPIDKHNDSEKSRQLRRLTHPFLLRRTKKQVATDLPDKTETVLWCEMDREQRMVYEEYKNYYRTRLLEKIDEVGMAKAGVYVLEGLLRLRQICDSPMLLQDPDVQVRNSVKIAELLREVKENTGAHKLLVFSQFTGMLKLIAEALDGQRIDYCYLDGSTPAEARRGAVDRFQEEASVKLFLISLKAGGVGLNLTAADYVYIVDPWWNPAAEQQAIDRTHRIGQKNKIFAYRMICKDSVEEKIVSLQDRKKQIADDLVTEDAGFVKKLTRDDIAFLFS